MLCHSRSHKPESRGRTAYFSSLSGIYAIPTQTYLMNIVMVRSFAVPVLKKIKAIGAPVFGCERASRSTSFDNTKRRRSRTRFTGCLKASLTVEAALALPVCIGAFFLMICMFRMMSVYEGVNRQLCAAARKSAAYSVSEDGVSTAEAYKTFYESLAGADIDCSFIRGGRAGIILKVTEDGSDKGIIRIEATYRMKIPGFVLPAHSLTIHDTVSSRSWTGIPLGGSGGSGSDSGKRQVYVAENGVVYHTDSNCTYLSLSIHKVPSSSLAGLRNKYGKKYYPCEKCAIEGGGDVYITEQGDAWHSSRDCSGLKRSVTVMTEDAAERRGLRSCPRCGGK